VAIQSDALVIAAHPDDAEFGAAGTAALWTREGKTVVYVLCTSGEKGTSDRNVNPDWLARVREREQLAAAEALGVGEVAFLRYPDQVLEDTAQFRMDIVRAIRTYRPTVVITSDPYRRYLCHRDHRVTGQDVLDAVFPFARDHLAYPALLDEGFEPHKVKEIPFWAAEDINYRVDITRTFALKLAALRCHESQVKEMQMPDLESLIEERCRSMAKGEDYDLAEGFHRVEIPS
jgi:LmbE family N-acetylglucosaminyl deacetylase